MDEQTLHAAVAKEIKRRRLEACLTQGELGELMGTTRNYVCILENQNRSLQIDSILGVCKALRCTLDEFFHSIYNPEQVKQVNDQAEKVSDAEDQICETNTVSDARKITLTIEIIIR